MRWTCSPLVFPREQILDELPDLEEEDIEAALYYDRRRVDHPFRDGGLAG